MAAKDPLKGVAKTIQTIASGKTGIKTVDKQKKKDATITKNLKRMAKTSRVRAKPQTLDITPKAGSALSIQKETITMAKDGGLMEAIEKVKKEDAVKMENGGEALSSPVFKGKSFGKRTADINTPTGRRMIQQIRKIMPDASRDEIIKFGLNAGVLKKAKGGEVPVKMAEGGVPPRRTRSARGPRQMAMDPMDQFFETIEPFQGVLKKGEQLRNIDGKTMIVKMIPNPMAETGRNISDRDRQIIMQMMGARKMENGGKVPPKFKGFSKLPEDVQEQMNPTLAKKFKKGGVVKMGKGGGVCKGMGIARAGGKFKLR